MINLPSTVEAAMVCACADVDKVANGDEEVAEGSRRVSRVSEIPGLETVAERCLGGCDEH